MPTALAVRVTNKTMLADALIAAGYVDALSGRVTRIRTAVVNLLTTDECVTRIARAAVADALVVLRHASCIDAAAVYTRIFTVEIGEASLGDVAIFILEALYLLAALTLVIWVTDVKSIGAGTLRQMIINNTDCSRGALEELAAILAPPLPIRLIKLADLIRMRTVGVVDALWLWNLATSISAVGVSSVAFSAVAAPPMVEGHTVGIGRTAKADAHLCTLHDTNCVGNAGRGGRAACVVPALITFSLHAAEHILPVPDEAMLTLAFVGMVPGDTDAVRSTLVELAGIKAPLASSVVSSADIGNSLAVVVVLALVLWPTSINWVIRVTLQALQAVAASLVVK